MTISATAETAAEGRRLFRPLNCFPCQKADNDFTLWSSPFLRGELVTSCLLLLVLWWIYYRHYQQRANLSLTSTAE